jgi:electron transfer flavoprotein alpha subunit
MKPLVFLEHRHGHVTPGSLGVLSRARALVGDGPVSALLAGGPDVAELVGEAATHGADRVFVAADDSLDPVVPHPRVDLLAAAVASGDYDAVLFANSVLAADVAAGLAVRLDAGINWDLTDLTVVDGRPVGHQLAFSDSVLFETGWRSAVAVALFRPGVFSPVAGEDRSPEVVTLAAPAVADGAARVVEERPLLEEGPALETAEVVVSGGMGLGGAEHFALAEQLAEVLGGVVGATRAAVYAGWYPHRAQVGQTGKTVTPKLYVALGISGAIQHKAGMQRSETIVAVNTDPAAPIFDFSDLAVVADVHQVVPELVALLASRRGAP